MKKLWKRSLPGLLALFLILGIGLMADTQKVFAGEFDAAKTFYDTYGSGIVFKDGYFYYGTRAKTASDSVSTTFWGTIGYRMKITTSTQTSYVYFQRNGSSVENVHEENSDDYVYNLYRIDLSTVKSKLSTVNTTAYNEFMQNGGTILVDSCMITIAVDSVGNRTNSGSMDDSGNFSGSVYTDYDGIAGAAEWRDSSSLTSFFNKTINYVTQLTLPQKIYVRYQEANGEYGEYAAVIDRNYVYGETVSWSRSADSCYKAASISYTVTADTTKYVSVQRKTYRQRVYVRYMDKNGDYGDYELKESKNVRYGASCSWSYAGTTRYKSASVSSYTVTKANDYYVSIGRKTYRQRVYVRYMDKNGEYGDYELEKSKNVRYGASYSWSYAGTACYKSASVSSYKVTKANDHYIDISRKQYRVTLSSGTGIASVSGVGTYYYGASCTINAVVKTGYTWTGWTGTYETATKKYTFTVKGTVSMTANARANRYYIEFHSNGGSGTMEKMTCYYDQTYTLPTMTFTKPEHPCTYVGWNTDAASFYAKYEEGQEIVNLTSTDEYTFHFYAIWDYAPDMTCADRYFTLYEAKHGIITEAELLRTAAATDREDGITVIRVKNYTAGTFTVMDRTQTVEITYQCQLVKL